MRIQTVLAFMVGLGLGEALRRAFTFFGKTTWVQWLYLAFAVGLSGYLFALGFRAYGELKEYRDKLGTERLKIAYEYWGRALDVILYWLVGGLALVILLGVL